MKAPLCVPPFPRSRRGNPRRRPRSWRREERCRRTAPESRIAAEIADCYRKNRNFHSDTLVTCASPLLSATMTRMATHSCSFSNISKFQPHFSIKLFSVYAVNKQTLSLYIQIRLFSVSSVNRENKPSLYYTVVFVRQTSRSSHAMFIESVSPLISAESGLSEVCKSRCDIHAGCSIEDLIYCKVVSTFINFIGMPKT